MGDRVAGSLLAGGIAAALFERTRTGRGQLVTTSLLATGLWMIGSESSDALVAGDLQRRPSRLEQGTPTLNCFQSRDGRWFWLLLMEPVRHWEALVRATGSERLAGDFAGGDPAELRARSAELTLELDEIFATKSMPEWTAIFDREDLWYAVVRDVAEAVAHPSARAAEALVDLEGSADEQIVNTPVMFADHPRRALRPSPRTGQHSRDILVSLGYDEGDLADLGRQGIVGGMSTDEA
jgi:crotonobetainyl-CoA:carnitine CoA-transferase CaiB-like acyl-CoA transferase